MPETPELTQKAVKVLVVEDSPTQLEELRFLLEEADFSVVTSINGKEGFAAAKANAIDLVISDILMPEMDGYALCKALRADKKLQHLPVILLTSLSDPRDVIRGLESGANNFLCKPYNPRSLVARVNNVLANQEIRRASSSEMGISIFFAGQRYFITADRLQILDLLLSTYENAVNHNTELIHARNELRLHNEQLEARVAERTAALLAENAERKRAEETIRALNEELEQRVQQRTRELEAVNHELESFAYSVSHDLRAPLRAIEGFSQALVQDHASQLDAQGVNYLSRVHVAVERMAALIDDLLKLSRVTRAELHHEQVDLSLLAREIIAEQSRHAPDRKVTVEVAAGLSATGDPNLLRQILQNLIENAWKFTSKLSDARIEVGSMLQDGRRVFFVRDNGAGFDMKYAGKLFGAFQRLHAVEEFPGTGIGLATVQRIVRRHGGKVWAEGEPNRGATFFFTL